MFYINEITVSSEWHKTGFMIFFLTLTFRPFMKYHSPPPLLVSHYATSRKTLRPPNSYAWHNFWTDPKRPSINISKFNYEYLAEILTKIKTGNKNIILMGDFFTNLLTKYYKNRGTYLFLEQLFNHNSTLKITLSTRITEKTATLIDKWLQLDLNPKPFTS